MPATREQGYVDHDGARVWYAAYGAGPAVILLHGGLGHSGNWREQVPALVDSGRRVVVIVLGEHDEFIKQEHAAYLARSIPGAEPIKLPGVSLFAPLQRPEVIIDHP